MHPSPSSRLIVFVVAIRGGGAASGEALRHKAAQTHTPTIASRSHLLPHALHLPHRVGGTQPRESRRPQRSPSAVRGARCTVREECASAPGKHSPSRRRGPSPAQPRMSLLPRSAFLSCPVRPGAQLSCSPVSTTASWSRTQRSLPPALTRSLPVPDACFPWRRVGGTQVGAARRLRRRPAELLRNAIREECASAPGKHSPSRRRGPFLGGAPHVASLEGRCFPHPRRSPRAHFSCSPVPTSASWSRTQRSLRPQLWCAHVVPGACSSWRRVGGMQVGGVRRPQRCPTGRPSAVRDARGMRVSAWETQSEPEARPISRRSLERCSWLSSAGALSSR
ncbi:hypothetical protein BJ982_005653 [Sphaerisporangium siamense]|uniref:Uncharacterized protein n=1 Tax=Sphaerisporangium siamense TaxID=795645 RepID=A0A7W7GD27_9ACTN|nr:hypothetical protein [Sphaerisporangium siamense]